MRWWLRISLVSLGSLGLIASPPFRAEVAAQTRGELSTIKRRATGLLERTAFAEAAKLVRHGLKSHPSDGELHEILATALLGQADADQARFAEAAARYAAALTLVNSVKNYDTHVADTEMECFTAEVRGLRSAYLGAIPAVTAAEARLEQASREAAIATVADRGTDHLLTAVWIDGYRIAREEALRAQMDYVARRGAESPSQSLAARKPIDIPAVQKRVLSHLLRLQTSRAADPLPYLAAAEWFLLTDHAGASSQQPNLAQIRRSYFAMGTPLTERDTAIETARAEYQAGKKAALKSLDSAMSSQTLALFEKAEELQSAKPGTVDYELYIQVVPADTNRADELLERLRKKDPGNALVPLELARRAAVANDYKSVILHLNRARGSLRLHRPLFVSVPARLRPILLNSTVCWDAVERASFSLRSAGVALDKLASAARPGPERQRALMLKAAVAAILMRSDYPHDWPLGATMRGDALSKLLRDNNIPPDLAQRLEMERQALQKELSSRDLPLRFAVLQNGNIRFVPFGAADHRSQGPATIASPSGTLLRFR